MRYPAIRYDLADDGEEHPIMGIRAEIIQLRKNYRDAHGNVEPKRLDLTPDDELRLASMTLDEAGAQRTLSVREQYKKFLGLEVIWDSPVRRCE
jgi:hypothetical protein